MRKLRKKEAKIFAFCEKNLYAILTSFSVLFILKNEIFKVAKLLLLNKKVSYFVTFLSKLGGTRWHHKQVL